MIYFHSALDYYLAGPSAVTLGKFDGVHAGHRLLLRRIREKETKGFTSVVFSMEAKRGALLMTNEEQRETICGAGIEAMIRCPFVPEVSGMHPEEFIREVLLNRLHAKYIAVGRDFRFGYRRSGDAAFLREYGRSVGINVEVIEKAVYHGREISSTYIREELQKGNMTAVNDMLSEAYPVDGIVLHGAHLGSRLGMPTINLIPDSFKLLPPDGVYYSITTMNNKQYPGITNIGYKPTVDGSFRGVETFLYGTQGDFYGKNVTVRLLARVRPEAKYESIEALKNQIMTDINAGRMYFHEQWSVAYESLDDIDRHPVDLCWPGPESS